MNKAITVGRYGIIAPGLVITRKRPLIGVVDQIAWWFDGKQMYLRRIQYGARSVRRAVYDPTGRSLA